MFSRLTFVEGLEDSFEFLLLRRLSGENYIGRECTCGWLRFMVKLHANSSCGIWV
jgi:hypothetical protein